MLISSSFLSNADWHAAQANSLTDVATQILPNAARQAERTASQQKPPQEPSQPAKASNPRHASHGNDKRAARHKEDASRIERNAEAHRRHARRMRQKATDEAQRADNPSTDRNPATPANQETEPSPFLAILGDVLPQDAPTGASANANGTHAEPSGSLDPFSPLPQMAFGSGLAGGTAAGNLMGVAVAGTQTAVAGNASAAEKTSAVAVPGAADNPSAHEQTELSAPPDGAFAIKTQAAASGPGTGQAQKQAEVAFAARIAERTATGTALGLNNAQATIAASRFDAASAGGQSGQDGHRAPQSGAPNQTVQTDPSGAAAEQTASMTSAAQPDARQASGAQNAALRSAGSQPGTQPGAPASASGSNASTASQSITAGTPVTAGPSTAAPAGNAGPAKAAADDRVPQFLEPQNELNQRPGESVRDISLKLTNQDQSSVQVRLSERAGELHVSVRTPDAGLTRGLREGLSDLVGRLEQSGYRTETWRPADNASTAQDQGRENPSQQHSSQQRNDGGSGTDSRQQQNPRDQQQPGAQTPEWVGELESSLQRSNRSWPPSATR